MPSFKVFKATKEGGIREDTTTKPDLTGDQVLLKITASGVCFTDIHYKNADGMVLGHEGAGIVQELGPGVRHLKKGDRVGFGYEIDSDGVCEHCLSGNEQYCPQRDLYGEGHLDQGSFAEAAVWREAFLSKIPDGLKDEEAAPLMCGGGTVWTALHKYQIPSTANIGIIGQGGLGHLAIQFAAKMGMNVIVFSSSERKKEEALKLGASHFVATKDAKELDIGGIKLDALIITTSAPIKWDLYLPVINRRAIIFPLTVDFGNFEIPQMPLIQSGITVQGTIVVSPYEANKMLEFAARTGVKPMLNKFPLNKQGIEEAMKALQEGKMRYRGVLIPQ
jgi:D-arabinose 1-dehydrogenase-like Zn-dependent alcohol dehydrogenase